MQRLEPVIGEARGTIGVTRCRISARHGAPRRPANRGPLVGGRWRTSLGPIAGREVARLVSVPGSAEGGLGTLAWHHVGVGTITFAVRGLGGPVVGGKRTEVKKK